MLLVGSLGSANRLQPLGHEQLGASPVGDVQATLGVGGASLAPVVQDALVVRDNDGTRHLEGLVGHVDVTLRIAGAADDAIAHLTCRLDHEAFADAFFAVMNEVHARELAVLVEGKRVCDDRHGNAVIGEHARRDLAGTVRDTNRRYVEHFEQLQEPLEVGQQAVGLLEPRKQLVHRMSREDVGEECLEVVTIAHGVGNLVGMFDPTPAFDTVRVYRPEMFRTDAEDIRPDRPVEVESEEHLVAGRESALPVGEPRGGFIGRHFILHVSESMLNSFRLEVRLKETLITPQDQRTGSKQPPHG